MHSTVRRSGAPPSPRSMRSDPPGKHASSSPPSSPVRTRAFSPAPSSPIGEPWTPAVELTERIERESPTVTPTDQGIVVETPSAPIRGNLGRLTERQQIALLLRQNESPVARELFEEMPKAAPAAPMPKAAPTTPSPVRAPTAVTEAPKRPRVDKQSSQQTLASVLQRPSDFATWSEAKQRAWEAMEANPNAYYYRNTHPGVQQTYGKWTPEQHSLFMKTLKVHDPTQNGQWGVFAMHMTAAGRVGYQCRNYYHQLLSQGVLKDMDYMDSKGNYVAKKVRRDASDGPRRKRVKQSESDSSSSEQDDTSDEDDSSSADESADDEEIAPAVTAVQTKTKPAVVTKAPAVVALKAAPVAAKVAPKPAAPVTKPAAAPKTVQAAPKAAVAAEAAKPAPLVAPAADVPPAAEQARDSDEEEEDEEDSLGVSDDDDDESMDNGEAAEHARRVRELRDAIAAQYEKKMAAQTLRNMHGRVFASRAQVQSAQETWLVLDKFITRGAAPVASAHLTPASSKRDVSLLLMQHSAQLEGARRQLELALLRDVENAVNGQADAQTGPLARILRRTCEVFVESRASLRWRFCEERRALAVQHGRTAAAEVDVDVDCVDEVEAETDARLESLYMFDPATLIRC